MTKSKQQKTTLLPTPIGKQVLAHLAQEGIREGVELRRWIELGFAAEKAGFRLEGTQVCSPLGIISGSLQVVDALTPAQPASGATAGVVEPVSVPRAGDAGEMSVQPAAEATEPVSAPAVVSQPAGGDEGTQSAPAAGAAPAPGPVASNAAPSVQTGDEAPAGTGDVGGDRGAGAAPASDAAAPVPVPAPEPAAETPLAAAAPVQAPVAETPIDSDLLGALRGL